jgi:hypothetical protein
MYEKSREQRLPFMYRASPLLNFQSTHPASGSGMPQQGRLCDPDPNMKYGPRIEIHRCCKMEAIVAGPG